MHLIKKWQVDRKIERAQWALRSLRPSAGHFQITASSRPLICNGTLFVQNFVRNFDMFRNLVKNPNSMCDVALSMWLLLSLFSPFSMQDERRGNTENEIAWELSETVKTHRTSLFEVLTPVFIDFQHYATLCSGNRKNESFCPEILVCYLEPQRPSL